jgi:preprotein translocase subunit YajC
MQEALSPNSPLVNLLPFALILGVFYFLLVRPQQQRAKEIEDMQAAIRSGDEIVTTGGLHGKVAKVNNDKTLFLEIAPKTQIRIDRDAVSRVARLEKTQEKSEVKS